MKGFIPHLLVILLCLFCQSLFCEAQAQAQAQAQAKISLPNEWWKVPSWSPDHKRVAVYSPGPEKVRCGERNGVVFWGYKYPEAEHTKIINCSDYSVIAEIDGVFASEWSPDGTRLAAVHGGFEHPRILSVFDSATGKVLKTLELKDHSSIAWSPQSDKILITAGKRVLIFDVLKGDVKEVAVPNSSKSEWFSEVWSSDGKYFCCVEWQRTIELDRSVVTIWNSDTLEIVSQITFPKCRSSGGRWSPKGDFFVCEGENKLHLMDVLAKKEIFALHSRSKYMKYHWTTDGKKLLYDDYDVIRVFDPATLKEELSIKGPANGFFDFSISPDNRFILIGDREILTICSLETSGFLGYAEFPGCEKAEWNPNGGGLVLQMRDEPPKFVALESPIKHDAFLNGKSGSPGWENNCRPRTLEECFASFDKELSAAQVAKFKNSKEDHLGIYGGGHIITDSMMCDVYSKWGMEALNRYFAAVNVTDPCEIDGIVLDSYWRHLNHKPLVIDQKIRANQAWRDQFRSSVPKSVVLPEAVLNYEIATSTDKNMSIRMLPGKIKLIVLYANGQPVDCFALRALKSVSEKFSLKDLSCILLLVDSKFLKFDDNGNDRSDKTHSDINALVSELSARLPTAKISRDYWKMLSAATEYPERQILILAENNTIIGSVHHAFSEDDMVKAIEGFIVPALRSEKN
ncbi:MAG: hypothetical protein DKT66_13880 [Candidatus Melainabacteria bacterium]|nr:MAG: hypothetical protein DKT66_13880 [Candidatus Melainabacteria bacterium]